MKNLSEGTRKYFYWFSLVLSTFIIINIIFNPFRILTFLGTGIIFSIAVIFDVFSSISISDNYVMSPILSIIFYPIVFYILYKISIRKINPIYFLFFIVFFLEIIGPLIATFITFYYCRTIGDFACFFIFATIPIVIISSLIAYFFYYKSEGLK